MARSQGRVCSVSQRRVCSVWQKLLCSFGNVCSLCLLGFLHHCYHLVIRTVVLKGCLCSGDRFVLILRAMQNHSMVEVGAPSGFVCPAPYPGLGMSKEETPAPFWSQYCPAQQCCLQILPRASGPALGTWLRPHCTLPSSAYGYGCDL